MTLPPFAKRLPLPATARAVRAGVALLTIGLTVLCVVALLLERRDIGRAADMRARNIAANVSQDITRSLEQYEVSLQAVAHGLQWPGFQSLDPALRQMILFGSAMRSPYAGFINAVDAAGTVIADSESITPRGGNFKGRDYFVAQRHPAGGAIFLGRPFLTGPAAMIPLSRRLSNPDGSFAGVIVGMIRLAYFRDLFARLDLGAHGTLALLRDDGMIVMRLPFSDDDPGRKLPPDAAFYRAAQGGVVDGVDAADGLRRRFLIQRVGALPLVVVAGLATTDIYAAWHRRAVTFGAVFLVLAIIDVALLYALGADERARLIARHQQEVAAKSRFVEAVSHELRTPLHSVLGYAELIALDGGLAPAQAGQLVALRRAGEHMRGVIDRVLDFGRSEAGARPSVPVPTDLAALLAECCAMIEPAAAAKTLRLDRHVAPELPPQIMIDAALLRQALLNLLSNAVKFTQRGGITLRATASAAGLRLAVIDTGIGIPSNLRDRLFQSYERLNAAAQGVPGTGLGLAIVAQLAERMDGKAGYDPNPAGGSMFWLELPLRAVDAVAPPPIAPAAVQARALRVLVADDSALNRDVMAGFLTRAGHRVVQAENGEQAVSLAGSSDFDVILLDLRMPVMDGWTALRHIRALSGQRGQTPVIAVTAQPLDDRRMAMRAAGFQAVLLKPIDRMPLLAAVAALGDAVSPPGSCAAASPMAMVADLAIEDGGGTNRDMTETHRAEFSGQVTRLVQLLRLGEASSELQDLVHRIAGDAAQLGFAELAMAARCYEAAFAAGGAPPPAAAAMLRDMAQTAAAAPRQCDPAC